MDHVNCVSLAVRAPVLAAFSGPLTPEHINTSKHWDNLVTLPEFSRYRRFDNDKVIRKVPDSASSKSDAL